MFHSALFAVLTFTISSMADVHRNDEHQFEAHFPTKVQRLNKSTDGGGQFVLAYSHDKTRTYLVGTVVNAEEMNHEQSQEFGVNFVEGYMRERKNATIIKEEELKLNDTTPKGTSFLVRHDTGSFFAWTTIENGKGYFVIVEGTSEAGLKADVVKNFQNSVKIMSVK